MNSTFQKIAVAIFLVSSSSLAQAGPSNGPPPGGGDPREACRSDAQSFCRGIQPGGGRIKDCLEDHFKEISDACYTALKNAPPPSTQTGNPPSRPQPPQDNMSPGQDNNDEPESRE